MYTSEVAKTPYNSKSMIICSFFQWSGKPFFSKTNHYTNTFCRSEDTPDSELTPEKWWDWKASLSLLGFGPFSGAVAVKFWRLDSWETAVARKQKVEDRSQFLGVSRCHRKPLGKTTGERPAMLLEHKNRVNFQFSPLENQQGEPNNGGLEDDFPNKTGCFFGSILIFRGVELESSWIFLPERAGCLGPKKTHMTKTWCTGIFPWSNFCGILHQGKVVGGFKYIYIYIYIYIYLCMFTPIWERFPFLLICFKGVESNS